MTSITLMGYEVHITHKKEWSDEDGPRIIGSEWQARVASDPETVIAVARS